MSILDFPLYADLPHAFWSIFIFLGAALGSFFNVLALRWPAIQIAHNHAEATAWVSLNKGKVTGLNLSTPLSLLGGRSQCPCCKKPIPAYHNIPLLSWLLLRGKSACCQAPIRFVYLGMELVGAAVFMAVAFTMGPTMAGLITGIIVMLLVLMARIDAIEGFIPDSLLFCTTALGYVLAMSGIGVGVEQAMVAHLAVFFSLYCIFQGITWLTRAKPMGMADYHLFSIAAVLLGSDVLLVFFMFLPMLILTQMCKRWSKWEPGVFARLVGSKAVPAGPAIVASTVLALGLRAIGLLP
ncbi:prepilin peptidase (plasmid) [Pseudomonas sp. Leaf58]|uniref:prepilin peptidase n=1 Tax=Pseudomonas sp. Leaf58 TaxID=1736226 RepID=UPI0006FDC18F|nr:A24 family peptidase [Pseudomonas sp. Leaf58]AYG48478.1 prepilin peptidase [Pseudomonas sp. Leaf58]KQN61978.1 hypothetical protein ASF02_07255 [Pseudomonas sp. Leaf58]